MISADVCVLYCLARCCTANGLRCCPALNRFLRVHCLRTSSCETALDPFSKHVRVAMALEWKTIELEEEEESYLYVIDIDDWDSMSITRIGWKLGYPLRCRISGWYILMLIPCISDLSPNLISLRESTESLTPRSLACISVWPSMPHKSSMAYTLNLTVG